MSGDIMAATQIKVIESEPEEDNDSERAELLTKLVGRFEDFVDQTQNSRALSEQDRDYNDHHQLTSEEYAELNKRGQPPIINNLVRRKMDYLSGLERQGRTDPKAFPRTPQHEDDSQAVTDALRYVADNSQFDKERSKFFSSYTIEGTGAAEVIVTPDDKREIQINSIDWDRYFYDYHSRDLGFDDKNWDGIVIWMDLEDAKDEYPDSKDVLVAAFSDDFDDTYSDRPIKWTDSKRKRVRIIQMYYMHDGVWQLAFFTKAGFLEEPGDSPYHDEDGNPQNRIISRSAYIDRDGMRFGVPRFMIEQQDGVNKRESKMLHLVSQRQTYSNKKSGIDARKAKSELAKPDGHLEFSGDAKFGVDFGILPTGDMANGQFMLLQEAKQNLGDNVVNGASTGQDQGDSGRAILAKQAGNQVELTPLFDGKRDWEREIYRMVWATIKQFWTAERWVRVTDDEKNVKFVGLNRPVTVREVLEKEFGQIPPQFEGDPRLDQVSRTENQVSEIDVDIIIEESPDVANLQIEQFEALVKLAPAGVVFPQETYIRASQLRDKEKLIESLSGGDDPEKQAEQQQKQQFAEQLQVEKATADIENIAADTLNKKADANKKQSETAENMVQRTWCRLRKYVQGLHKQAISVKLRQMTVFSPCRR